MQESTSLKYEPALEPLPISVGIRVEGEDTLHPTILRPAPCALQPYNPTREQQQGIGGSRHHVGCGARETREKHREKVAQLLPRRPLIHLPHRVHLISLSPFIPTQSIYLHTVHLFLRIGQRFRSNYAVRSFSGC